MKKSDAELAALFKPVMRENGVDPDAFSNEYIARAVGLVKSRIYFVRDLWAQAKFFFTAPTEYAAKDVKKRWSAETPTIMAELIELLRTIDDFSSAAAEKIVLDWIASKGYHLGNVMNAFRLTVVGECKGPHMFDITELLGKDETIARIARGCQEITLPE
jgi:glutamyl-tRNA synthetase